MKLNNPVQTKNPFNYRTHEASMSKFIHNNVIHLLNVYFDK